MRRIVVVALALLVARAFAFQADLVPARQHAGQGDVTGQLSIGGAAGNVHVTIDNVNDARGEPLDATIALQLRLRVNGFRRRANIPIEVSGGSGEASGTLGLKAGDRVTVSTARVRGPDHRPLAEIGVVTAEPVTEPPPPVEPPDTLAQCQADLAASAADLEECSAELEDCQFGQ